MPAMVSTAAKKKMVRVERASQKGFVRDLGAGVAIDISPRLRPWRFGVSRPGRLSPWCLHPVRRIRR